MDGAFAGGDMEALLDFYEPNAAVVAEPGMVLRGRDELRAFFAKVIGSGSATQLKTEVIEAEGIALFLSRWTMTESPSAGDIFVATSVLRKQPDGRWRVLIDNAFGPLVLGPEK